MKRYLLYVTLPYAYSILRPLEHEIRRRGGEAAWFVEEGCPVVLEEGEVRLGTIREAVAYNPVAVFAPGNYIPDFIPGISKPLRRQKRSLKSTANVKWNCLKAILIGKSRN